MKVSIIVPFYNVENVIRACLDSIFAQTYPNIEVILVNDCSTDNSMDVVEHHCEISNPRHEVILKSHVRNRGASAARNTGVNCATGDYLYFLDSDDTLTPTCIETLVRPLEQKKYDIVIGDYRQIGNPYQKWKLKIHGGEWNDNQLIFKAHSHQKIYINPFNKLCNRDFFFHNNLFFEEGVTHEDVLWSLRLCLCISSMFVVKEVTYLYMWRRESVSGSELWRDEIHAYIHLLPLMVDAVTESPCKDNKEDIYTYFDDIFLRRYKLCFMDHLKDEYFALRALDPRPTSWILKNGMKYRPYMRAHYHRLLPMKYLFNIIVNRTDKEYQKYKKNNRRRSIYYDKDSDQLRMPK